MPLLSQAGGEEQAVFWDTVTENGWGKTCSVGQISVAKAAGTRNHGCSKTSTAICRGGHPGRCSDLLLRHKPVVNEP